jgi:hypothetical protein
MLEVWTHPISSDIRLNIGHYEVVVSNKIPEGLGTDGGHVRQFVRWVRINTRVLTFGFYEKFTRTTIVRNTRDTKRADRLCKYGLFISCRTKSTVCP